MCYVIEFIENFQPDQYVKITVKRISDIDAHELNVWLTTRFDYLGVIHNSWGDIKPFKINIPFGSNQIPKITSKEHEHTPLKCKTSDQEYVSVQQCWVDFFINEEFCPHKVNFITELTFSCQGRSRNCFCLAPP